MLSLGETASLFLPSVGAQLPWAAEVENDDGSPALRPTLKKSGLEEALAPARARAARMEEGGLKFGDSGVWGDEEKRTREIIEGAIAFLEARGGEYGALYPGLFAPDRVAARVRHLKEVWEGIQADMAGQAGDHPSIKDLRCVHESAQISRFGGIVWPKAVTGAAWKDVPYNVAQALLFSEAAWATGFFDAPENPSTDFYKPGRDKQQEEALVTAEGRPMLPYYTRFVLGGHRVEALQSLSRAKKQAVLARAVLLTVKGNALDPNVLDKLQVDVAALNAQLVDESVIIVNDLGKVVKAMTSDKIQEIVLFPDNVGPELIGATLLTAVYLKMYPGRKVTWSVKDAAYLKVDVTRRDLRGWKVEVPDVDGRSWFERFQDAKYNPGNDSQVTALLSFFNGERGKSDRFEVLVHAWTESGLLGNAIPMDLADRIGGPQRMLIMVGEWLSERITNGIPYPRGTSYETAWRYLRDLGVQYFVLLRVIKDKYIAVIPEGHYDGEVLEGGVQGVISYYPVFAGMEERRAQAIARVMEHTDLDPDASAGKIDAAARYADSIRAAALAVVAGEPTRYAAKGLAALKSETAVSAAVGFGRLMRVDKCPAESSDTPEAQDFLKHYDIPLGDKQQEIQDAVDAVAEQRQVHPGLNLDINIVINVKALQEGRLAPDGQMPYVQYELQQLIAFACECARDHGIDKVTIMVIGENFFLTDDQKWQVYRWAIEAGADFLKTATGRAGPGATVRDVRLMRKIADTVGAEVNRTVGIKIAGGVSAENLMALLEAAGVRETDFDQLGPETLRARVRVGLSKTELVLAQLAARAGAEEQGRGKKIAVRQVKPGEYRFSGWIDKQLDEKDRLIIPPTWLKVLRAQDGFRFHLTHDARYGYYLRIISEARYRKLEADFSAQLAKMDSNEARDRARRAFNPFFSSEPSKKNRAPLGQEFARALGTRETVLVGVGDHVELWPKEAFYRWVLPQRPDARSAQAALRLLSEYVNAWTPAEKHHLMVVALPVSVFTQFSADEQEQLRILMSVQERMLEHISEAEQGRRHRLVLVPSSQEGSARNLLLTQLCSLSGRQPMMIRPVQLSGQSPEEDLRSFIDAARELRLTIGDQWLELQVPMLPTLLDAIDQLFNGASTMRAGLEQIDRVIHALDILA